MILKKIIVIVFISSFIGWSFGISKTTLPVVISLSLLLAILTFEFIENPLRHRKWFSKKLLNIISGVFISFIGIISMLRGGDFNKRWSNKLMRARVILQGLAILLILLTAYLFTN